MEQAILAWENLHEAAIRHDAANSSFIDLTYLGNSHDSLNLAKSRINAVLVRCAYLHFAYAIHLVDGNGSACIFLHLLNNLAARADNSTDEFLRNLNLYDAWNLWLQLWT